MIAKKHSARKHSNLSFLTMAIAYGVRTLRLNGSNINIISHVQPKPAWQLRFGSLHENIIVAY